MRERSSRMTVAKLRKHIHYKMTEIEDMVGISQTVALIDLVNEIQQELEEIDELKENKND